MEVQTTRRWEALTRRWGRVMRVSFIVSVLLHILIVLLFRTDLLAPDVPSSAAGDRANDAQAAAGGGTEIVAIRIITPPPAQVEEIIPVPVPIPEPTVPVIEEPPPPTPPPSTQPGSQQANAGEGRGNDTGPGTETGTGRGDGGTGEEGLNRTTAPSPRGLILPPSDRPGSVRGRTVTVFVWVTERGSVVSDSTRLSPGTGDSRFDNRLRRQASEWVFHPAQRDGRPIAAWFEYTITL